MVRHLVSLVVEFPIADFLLAINQSNCIGCTRHLRLKEFMHARVTWVFGSSLIPVNQQLLPLPVRQERQIGQRLRRPGDDSIQQTAEMTEHSRAGRLLQTTWS